MANFLFRFPWNESLQKPTVIGSLIVKLILPDIMQNVEINWYARYAQYYSKPNFIYKSNIKLVYNCRFMMSLTMCTMYSPCTCMRAYKNEMYIMHTPSGKNRPFQFLSCLESTPQIDERMKTNSSFSPLNCVGNANIFSLPLETGFLALWNLNGINVHILMDNFLWCWWCTHFFLLNWLQFNWTLVSILFFFALKPTLAKQ